MLNTFTKQNKNALLKPNVWFYLDVIKVDIYKAEVAFAFDCSSVKFDISNNHLVRWKYWLGFECIL